MTAPARRPGARPTRRRRLRRYRRRAAALVALVWLRLSFAVLQVVARDAADRRALDVWCTLPPGARSRHDTRPYRGDVVRLPMPCGGEITAEVWGDGPVVYLMHGWGGWRGQLGGFVRPLVDAGHRVVAVDAPGHGDADAGFMGPRRGTVMEMIESLEVAGEAFGPAAGVVAHSLGCTVAGQAVRQSLTARRLVLVAPNHGFTEVLDHFCRLLWLNRRTRKHLQGALEQITERPISDFDLEPLGADGSMPDTLVLHDRGDAETPFRVAEDLAARWPNARLVVTEGLGHYKILADAGAVTAVVEHLTAGERADDAAGERADVGAEVPAAEPA